MVQRSVSLVLLSALALTVLSVAPPDDQPATHPTATSSVDGFPVAENPPSPGGPPAVAGDGERLAAAGTRLSQPVQAPIAFSMVGFRIPDGAQVEFRTSPDGRTWSDWRHAPVPGPDEGPDPGSGEDQRAREGRFSQPVWVGEAAWVQTRAAGDTSLREVTAHVIDTVGASRSLPQRAADALASAWRGQPQAEAVTHGPSVVSRAQWGANESWRNDSPSYAATTKAGFVHHTATTNSYTPTQARSLVRGIYRYHTQVRGWDDIGYNLLVDRYGQIYEGRAGGIERSVIGAHAGGFNTESFGIAVLGSHGHAPPTDTALDSLARIAAWKFDVHNIDPDPGGTVVMRSGGSTRYPSGTRVRLHTLSGHRDVSQTSCPGHHSYEHLPSLRKAVQRYSNQSGIGGGLLDGLPLVGTPDGETARGVGPALAARSPRVRLAARGRPCRRRGPAGPAPAGCRRSSPSTSSRRSSPVLSYRPNP